MQNNPQFAAARLTAAAAYQVPTEFRARLFSALSRKPDGRRRRFRQPLGCRGTQ